MVVIPQGFMPETLNGKIIVCGGFIIDLTAKRARAGVDYLARTAKDLINFLEKATLGLLIWWADTIAVPAAIVKNLRAS